MTSEGSDDANVQHARAILSEFDPVPPQHASRETVQAYTAAVDLLAEYAASPLWFHACDRLASHLLELPTGNRRDNVMLARQIYGQMVAADDDAQSFEQWFTARMGLGNTILADPGASAKDMELACEYFDALVPVARENAGPVWLAKTLAHAADAHSRAQLGDLDRELDTAIRLQSEAIELLTGLDQPDAIAALSHAQYNLGRFFWQRRTGVRSQNVDRAVHALAAARDLRPADRDPVGRARALRALAEVLPEWSGADSVAHAAELADEARAEAARVAETDEREARRQTAQAELERMQSALRVDMNWLYALPIEARREAIEDHIGTHERVLGQIERDATPARWADWTAGLGRLYGRLCHVGASAAEVQTAHDCHRRASECIDPSCEPRLYRDIMASWGEFSHEIGEFEVSFQAHRTAAIISEHLLAGFDDADNRLAEIAATRGYGLLGAYAAARLDRGEAAAELAEFERNRGIADLLSAHAALTTATDATRNQLADTLGRIQALQSRLNELAAGDRDGQMAHMRAKLSDHLGVDPSLLQVRRVDENAHASNPNAAEADWLRGELAGARSALRGLLAASAEDERETGKLAFDIGRIRSIAASAGVTLVYLVATVHGGAIIAVLPDGAVESLPLEALSSDLTGLLVNGSGEAVGLRDAVRDEFSVLDECLAGIGAALTAALAEPLATLLRSRDVGSAVALIGLGRIGLLPLHVANIPGLTLTYAPSARALSAALPTEERTLDAPAVVVADPKRDDTETLQYATAEGRWLEHLAGADRPVTVLASGDASRDAVQAILPDAGIVHFACHGEFRPSDPMESRLALAGDDELELGDLFFGAVGISRARLAALSACETGSVEFYRSSDEATGFPMGLMLAGVPAVLSTMWSVDDAAAMFFVTRFYELLLDSGLAPAAATAGARDWLRTAHADALIARIAEIRECLAPHDEAVDAALRQLEAELSQYEARSRPFSAPSDWGAFCLTGL
ncbi:MAG: CHAT domain-containing protein [Gammaproteobacteria bacterium]